MKTLDEQQLEQKIEYIQSERARALKDLEEATVEYQRAKAVRDRRQLVWDTLNDTLFMLRQGQLHLGDRR